MTSLQCITTLLITEYSISITYVLSSELITVKKGTPLYGQPAWWGDELVSDQGEMACATVPKHNGKTDVLMWTVNGEFSL